MLREFPVENYISFIKVENRKKRHDMDRKFTDVVIETEA